MVITEKNRAQRAAPGGLALFDYLATQVHLRVPDPLFLKRGSLERLLKLSINRTYAFCSFPLRGKVGMRGFKRKNSLFFNPLTLTLSLRERGPKTFLRKS
jgi:hypothetical protein